MIVLGLLPYELRRLPEYVLRLGANQTQQQDAVQIEIDVELLPALG